MSQPCSVCGYSSRVLYGYKSPQVAWVTICPVNGWGAELLECPSCQQRWMRLYYEPWAAYPYIVPWPFDEPTWRRRTDPGTSGCEHYRLDFWHRAVIYELLDAATPEWRARYLSEGVTEGRISRFREGVTSAQIFHGDGPLAYEDIVAR